MHKLKNNKWLPVLMVVSIVAIAAFQFYWLQKAYEREAKGLERQTNMLFAETVGALQGTKLKLDRVNDSSRGPDILFRNLNGHHRPPGDKMVKMINVMLKRAKDSSRETIVMSNGQQVDSIRIIKKGSFPGRRERIMQFLVDIDSLQDSIRVKELQTAYARRLEKENIDVPFTVKRVQANDTLRPVYNEVTLGFRNPITYRLDLGNTTGFLLRRISVPVLFSIFLVAFTILSFYLLFRNLLRQQRLADIKNEFISNITHELKTPIATVVVAIDALRSFNANLNAERTKEYLDISANELQRLSLLVDKVLKLSMFEKREIELRYEELDMRKLVDEVTSSMRLQFEKQGAQVSVNTEGDTTLEGDRLHLVSVIFNLLDNALKYSPTNPKIHITIGESGARLLLTIADSGIGIPAEYQGRIFEKFFRVPTGNLHNAKGYGLGLSYVAHVVKRHNGSIRVESVEGNGSRFIISLPRHKA